jgi:zinc-ribbon domain
MAGGLFGLLSVVGLGFWAYSDAKALEQRGIKVGSFSPSGWGLGIVLLAIVFGTLYVIQRGRALHGDQLLPPFATDTDPSASLHADSEREKGSYRQNRFCGNCGHELRASSAFCPQCGTHA